MRFNVFGQNLKASLTSVCIVLGVLGCAEESTPSALQTCDYSKFHSVNPDGQLRYHWIVRSSSNSGSTWALSDSFVFHETPTFIDSTTMTKGCDSEPKDIGQTADGSIIYVTGFGQDKTFKTNDGINWIGSNPRFFLVTRKSSDNGASWQTVDEFQNSSIDTVGSKVAVDSGGRVFVAGYYQGSDNIRRMIVRRSTDSGASWSTVDTFSNGTSAEAYDIRASGTDEIYISGDKFIRKSSDHGDTWATITLNQFASRMSFDGLGNPFFLALSVNASPGFLGFYLTTDGGSSWTEQVHFLANYDGSESAYFNSGVFTSLPSGDSVLQVSRCSMIVGAPGTMDTRTPCPLKTYLVNRSTGTTTELDSFTYPHGNHAFTNSSVRDDLGVIYSVVAATDQVTMYDQGNGAVVNNGWYDGTTHWLVRRSADSGATWSTIDDYIWLNTKGTQGVPAGIVKTADNRIFVTGFAYDGVHEDCGTVVEP